MDALSGSIDWENLMQAGKSSRHRTRRGRPDLRASANKAAKEAAGEAKFNAMLSLQSTQLGKRRPMDRDDVRIFHRRFRARVKLDSD